MGANLELLNSNPLPYKTVRDPSFTNGNLTQTVGSLTPVTITPFAGRSTGAITILYKIDNLTSQLFKKK